MGIIDRGIKNAFRNGIRSLGIIFILAVSIGMALIMFMALKTVQAKIASVKSSIGNYITVSPAGIRGFEGGGEQQRISIARALVNKPKIILADEPTGNLDSITGKIIIDLLKSLAKSKNTTIIAVTHDHEIAKQAKITFKLKDGQLVN